MTMLQGTEAKRARSPERVRLTIDEAARLMIKVITKRVKPARRRA